MIYNELESRADVMNFVTNKDGVGIELGVAEGSFSEQILRRMEDTQFYLYSVDAWAGDRGHNTNEYQRAVLRLEPWKRSNTILKMFFNDALALFEDGYFDFIYVDGYAHTGENKGRYFEDWWPKLKKGGIMAGDDYHSDWPAVVKHVDRFAGKMERELCVIPNLAQVDKWSKYPTWFLQK